MIKRKLARPKGKRFYTTSIAVTLQQKDFLDHQPNASELIRRILDDLIASESIVEQKMSLISLSNQIREFEVKLDRLRDERRNFLRNNDSHWQKVKNADGSFYRDDEGNYFLESVDQGYTPIPEDTDDARVAFKVLGEYDKAIKSVEEQIAVLKKKILQAE